VVNVFIFFLAFFLDFFEIAFIIMPMLGPVADKLGIDMVWFGVLLCVNMQTSFMHPPFGFALFYLRGISDTLFKNGSIPRKVESKDIYLGSIPWVLMQLVLVVIVIFFPATVTSFLDKPVVVDESQATELLQQVDMGTKSNSNDEAIKAMERAKEDDPMAAFKDLPKDGEKK
jgi:TRAP-type mannitol/chloroaromatic compound transport system permease large subunit